MRATILAILAAIVLPAFTANAQTTPRDAVNFYSRQKEAALGATLAAQVRNESTPLDSALLRDFVSRIGARLETQLPTAPFPFTFAVIAGDLSNSTYEPLAVPGGYIFIPAELILAAKDEAEFAGMLAHSMVHISERHYTRAVTSGAITQEFTVPLIFWGGWTGYGSKQGIATVGFLQFEREAEVHADELAVQITAAAGYDPSALLRYVSRVQATQPGTNGRVFSAFPEDRVSLVNTAVQAVPAQPYVVPDPAAFGQVQAEVRRLLPVAQQPRLKNLAGNQRPILKRQN